MPSDTNYGLKSAQKRNISCAQKSVTLTKIHLEKTVSIVSTVLNSSEADWLSWSKIVAK
jgi:hypothetical protein